MDTFGSELRYIARRLARSPAFTAVSVVTLILGMAATSTIFGIINSVLLQPLPYEDAGRLAMVWGRFPAFGIEKLRSSEPEVLDLKERMDSLSHVAAFDRRNVILTESDQSEQLPAARVTSEFFPLLGVDPVVGRAFTPEEDQPGHDRVAVISTGLWERRFGSDPAAVGGAILLDNESYQVVGVLGPSFAFPEETEIWLPLALDRAALGSRAEHYLHVLARVSPDTSLEVADSELAQLTQALRDEHPAFYHRESGWGLRLVPLQEEIVGDVGPALIALLIAVGFVLLISCANVANLMLVRAQIQEQEVSVRLALGAGRWHLVRQFLGESLLLSLIGGTIAVVVAWWGLRLLVASQPENLPRLNDVGIDASVVAFTFGVVLVTTLVIGMVPALRSARLDFSDVLNHGESTTTGGLRRQRIRSLLVVLEIASAVILLVGAGLLIGGLLRLIQINPGFRPANVLTMRITLPRVDYPAPPQRIAFHQSLLDRIASMPGVEAVGSITQLPFGSDTWNATFFVDGRSQHEPGMPVPTTNPRVVGREYFKALGIPLLEGRVFRNADGETAARVAIVDEVMADRFWPGEDPLGRRVALMGADRQLGLWMTVVGVVGSVKDAELQSEPEPHLYLPYAQDPMRSMYLAVRGTSAPDALVSSIRTELRNLDRNVPLYEVLPMSDRLSRSVAQQKLTASLLTLFAGLALALAAVGLYGVMSYSVAQRKREVGIRMALGARRSDVVGMILRQGAQLTIFGLAIGIGVAAGVTRVVSSLIHGVGANEPVVFLGAILLLAFVALVASYIPARRTTRVSPVRALHG